MKKGIVLSSLFVLALFTVLAVSTASATVFYLVPDDSGAEGYLNTTTVQLRINATQEITGCKATILQTLCANITDFTHGPEWEQKTKAWWPDRYVITVYNEPDSIPTDLPPGDYLIGTYTIQCNSTTPCMTDLIFRTDEWRTDVWSLYVPHVPFTTDNGTFTCIAPPETFSKDLVAGWNLISLPLTNATAMTVANIIDPSLGGSYDALFRYDAGTHAFVQLASSADEMANGVGYFIHLTSADTWTYTGVAYTGMNVTLQPGLNMPGWLNCTKSTSDGLSSIAGSYNYVARWNATSQKFETYNPVAPEVFNDFSTLARGEGYFISAKAAGTLSESC